MLWEELPVSVEAFNRRGPAVGENLRKDERLEVRRRNLMGDSMLSVPLMGQTGPFGVLALLTEHPRPGDQWNITLAMGLAQVASVAISNVRLYEVAQQKQQGLLSRMKQLELLAEHLAHDLKGPGARMCELTKLFVQEYGGQVDERAARWLKLMEDNGEDIVRRVEGILSVARIGIGGESVKAVDSGLVLKDVLATHSEEIRRLAASIHIPPHLPIVACHEIYLRQLFDNVITNGLKYAKPQQQPRITLHWEVQGNMVQFSVHDEGLGIPETQRARVFEPFVRLKQSDAAGSGIGLTIVKRIVELYGGRVWIESSGDAGCTVTFTIPWFREEALDPLSIPLSDTSPQEHR